jgi:hypothetical protein
MKRPEVAQKGNPLKYGIGGRLSGLSNSPSPAGASGGSPARSARAKRAVFLYLPGGQRGARARAQRVELFLPSISEEQRAEKTLIMISLSLPWHVRSECLLFEILFKHLILVLFGRGFGGAAPNKLC